MRALVISGGGCKGAFAGGIAEHLIKLQNKRYDLYVGTSTGSLLIPLLSIGEVKKLKDIFTSVTQNEIFSSCPFIISQKNGEFKTRINHFSIIRMFMSGSKTFGESMSLRKLICRIVTEEDFNRIKSSHTDVVVSVSNLSCNCVEYKTLKECDYHDFCDWIWASASAAPFMSIVEKNGFEYADGGLGSVVPIYEAIRRGAKEIDVIVLKSEQMVKRKPARNALEVTTRAFDFMLNQIVVNDMLIGDLESRFRDCKINIYQPKEILTSNSLIFDPVQMANWWKQGYEFSETKHISRLSS